MKTTNFSESCRNRLIEDSLNLGWIHFNTLRRDNEAKENHIIAHKSTLFEINIEVFLAKKLKYALQVIQMLPFLFDLL